MPTQPSTTKNTINTRSNIDLTTDTTIYSEERPEKRRMSVTSSMIVEMDEDFAKELSHTQTLTMKNGTNTVVVQKEANVRSYIDITKESMVGSGGGTEKRRMSLTSSMLARMDEDFEREMAGELFWGMFYCALR